MAEFKAWETWVMMGFCTLSIYTDQVSVLACCLSPLLEYKRHPKVSFIDDPKAGSYFQM